MSQKAKKRFHIVVKTKDGIPPFHHMGFFGVNVSTFTTIYPTNPSAVVEQRPGVFADMDKETFDGFVTAIKKRVVRWRTSRDGKIRGASIYMRDEVGYEPHHTDEALSMYIGITEAVELPEVDIVDADLSAFWDAAQTEQSLENDKEDQKRKKRHAKAKASGQPVNAGPSDVF